MNDRPPFEQYTWSWATKDRDSINVYSRVNGSRSVAEMLAWLHEAAPGTPLESVRVNGTIIYPRLPTEDEVSKDQEWERKRAERHEEWERTMWEKLKEKYGDSA